MNLYVLAGGDGSRLGGIDKSSLQVGESTFLERIAHVAQGEFEEVVVVRRRPSGSDTLRVVLDADHAVPAPIHGVAAALRDSDGKQCFVLSVDTPRVSTELLRRIVELAAGESARDIVVPEADGRLQMLCGVYRKTLLPLIEERIASGVLSLKSLCDQARIRVIPQAAFARFIDSGEFLNVNTLTDLGTLRASEAAE